MYEMELCRRIAAQTQLHIDTVGMFVSHWLPPVSAPLVAQKNAAASAARAARAWEKNEIIAFVRGDIKGKDEAVKMAALFREIERLCLFECQVKSLS